MHIFNGLPELSEYSRKEALSSMEAVKKEREKRNLVEKAWQRWVAWVSRRRSEKGCFSVYVGEDKERFKVKTKLVNHPSFKKLLDYAELEYGFACDGPIWLPCDVEMFYKVMQEMEEKEEKTLSEVGFSKEYCSSFAMCSPSHLFNISITAHLNDDDEPRCAYQLLPGY